MFDLLSLADSWIKALHIVSVISWMAALFYLPRLFVYHVAEPAGSSAGQTFEVMERRLLRGIMNPAMILTWAAGIGMIALAGMIAERDRQ